MSMGVVERDSTEEVDMAREARATASRADTPLTLRVPAFRRVFWLAAPVLAVAAYASVLRIGFLADDFPLFTETRDAPFDLSVLLPRPWLFYRPVSNILTWTLGVPLWGSNPVPYHLISLLLHAATALVLGLWLAEVTSRKWLGLLAGCLFAVFPLHLEAVGWVAAQWDVWAAMFGLLSLWLFTRWWRGSRRSMYVLSLACYFLGLFSKESLFTWLPVLALSAWLVTLRFGLPQVRRVLLALAPFAGVLALNIAIRLVAWGNLGGYPEALTPARTAYFDALVGFLRFFLAPINPALFGGLAQQIASLAVGALLFVGLVWYGRASRKLLLVAGAWIFLTLSIVLNLGMQFSDLQNNRFAYLASAGYCVLVAVLLGHVIAESGRFRQAVLALTGLLLLAGVAVSWVQLRPWHTASVQTQELGDELTRLIPPQTNAKALVWYVEDPPDNYKGAYLLRLGMGVMRHMRFEDYPFVLNAGRADKVDLTSGLEDKFALRFYYSRSAERFHVSYAAGLTSDPTPPSPQQQGESYAGWDFASCSQDMVGAWQIVGGEASCRPGQGLVFTRGSDDTQLIGPPLSLDAPAMGARFVRLRAAVSYPAGTNAQAVSQWFWQEAGQDWNPEHVTSARIRSGGKTFVYWTFLPASDLQGAITRLRFDPINEQATPTVRWLAADLVR